METFEICDQIDVNEWHGFVYLIENKVDGSFYVGKKGFFKKNKQPSDWKKYKSSCIPLKTKIKKYYEDFTFTVLALAKDETALRYMEVKYMMLFGCLTDTNSYNNNMRYTTMRKIKDIDKRTKILYKNKEG